MLSKCLNGQSIKAGGSYHTSAVLNVTWKKIWLLQNKKPFDLTFIDDSGNGVTVTVSYSDSDHGTIATDGSGPFGHFVAKVNGSDLIDVNHHGSAVTAADPVIVDITDA